MLKKEIKNIFTCVIGNTLEWYDFALFGAFASTISQLFFPEDAASIALLKTYGLFAMGFIMRPLGSIFFGYIGDKKGRRTALIFSIYFMAFPTVCIGILPTYSQIGAMAPTLLIFIRLIQGFSMGGEYGSSMVYLFEHASMNRKGFLSSWADFGCLFGVLLGTLSAWITITFLSQDDYLNWGWRLPFLGSICLAIFALLYRTKLDETKEYVKSEKIEKRIDTSINFRMLTKKVILGVFIYAFGNVNFYILLVFVPNYFIQIHLLPPSSSWLVTSVLSSLITVLIPLGGYLSDAFGRIKLLCYSIIFISVFSLLFFAFMNSGSLSVSILLQICIAIALASFYGGEAAFFSELFPLHMRCRGVSIVLSIANICFGGSAPFIASLIVQTTDDVRLIAFIIIIPGILALASIWNILLKQNSKLRLNYAQT